MNEQTYCGYVAIIGRPNVGKSTLINQLVGQKISITARKPQTTRHRILGIDTEGNTQAVYVDTPGFHADEPRAINRHMNHVAMATLKDVDLIVFVIDSTHWTKDDDWILEKIVKTKTPVILAINKVDKISDKGLLLPELEKYHKKMHFTDVIPISALKGDNVTALKQAVLQHLPESPFFFPDDQVTNVSNRFITAEIIREKIIRLVGQEVPYALTVQIEEFKKKDHVIHINAIIWVEREGQKAIIIGKQGSLLKKVGQQARKELEKMLENKVFLTLWVKVKEGWSDDDHALKNLGYHDT